MIALDLALFCAALLVAIAMIRKPLVEENEYEQYLFV